MDLSGAGDAQQPSVRELARLGAQMIFAFPMVNGACKLKQHMLVAIEEHNPCSTNRTG